MTHKSKIKKIILGRIEKKADENPAEDQFGFRKKRDTREAILFAKHCKEKFYSKQKDIYRFCRLTESFLQRKLERNDEDTKED